MESKTCCICDNPISEKYLDFLKKNAALPSYIDVCQEHGHLRHSFDLKKAPGENLAYLKHLRVEYGNDSDIQEEGGRMKEEGSRAKTIFDIRQSTIDNRTSNIQNPTSNIQYLSSDKPTHGIIVDGACNPNPGGLCEWQCVSLIDKKTIFKSSLYPGGTNNIAEFLGLVHAISHLEKINSFSDIYSDSVTAIKWVRKKKCGTTYPRGENNVLLYSLIDRAEKWLKENEYKNKIIQWNTKLWGENPADYGRK